MDRTRAWPAGIALAASLLAGCAGPDYTYVRDDDGTTYFKVPSSWRKVELGSARQEGFWVVAFDAHAQPSVDHLLIGSGDADDRPFVLAKVQKLSRKQQNQASLDMLRNSGGPPVVVSQEVRKKLESDETSVWKGFELLADEILPTRDGVRGVHTVFNYRLLDGPVQTFDETAYLSADGTRISTLLIRCSAACYRKRAAEIGMIAKSFKVKRILT